MGPGSRGTCGANAAVRGRAAAPPEDLTPTRGPEHEPAPRRAPRPAAGVAGHGRRAHARRRTTAPSRGSAATACAASARSSPAATRASDAPSRSPSPARVRDVLIAHLPEEEADARRDGRAHRRGHPGGAARCRPAHGPRRTRSSRGTPSSELGGRRRARVQRRVPDDPRPARRLPRGADRTDLRDERLRALLADPGARPRARGRRVACSSRRRSRRTRRRTTCSTTPRRRPRSTTSSSTWRRSWEPRGRA